MEKNSSSSHSVPEPPNCLLSCTFAKKWPAKTKSQFTYGTVRLIFLASIRDYGGDKSCEIGVDGDDVLLIPHPPQCPTTLHQPHVGGSGREGVGHVGLGGGVGQWGGGVLEEYRAHMHIYTHTLVPGCRWERAG